MSDQTRREYYRKRKAALMQERQPYESSWRELSDNFAPHRGRWIGETAQQRRPRSQKKIIDPTPLTAARTASSGMLAGFTSPSRIWFRAITRDKALAANIVVSRWLDEVSQLMYDAFAKSNFYNAMPQVYEEAVVFGTSAVLCVPDDKTILRFFPLTIGTYCLSANADNVIDTLYRDVTMSARQMSQLFGRDAMSKASQKLLDEQPDALIAVTHSIEPREEYNRTKLGAMNMPYVSCWWETNCTEDKILRLHGYPRFQVFAPRWSVTDSDVYGYGAGSIALGMAKDLQISSRRKAQNKDQMTNPTLLAPSTLRNRTISQMSGDIVYYDATGGDSPTVKAMREVDPRSVQVIADDIQVMRDGINNVFYVDLFLMLTTSDRRQFTAREVEERHEEKLLMLAPVLERFEDEGMDVALKLMFEELLSRGKIPPPPAELGSGESIDIEYISILSQAQRSVGIGSIERVYTTAGNLFQMTQDPSVWDNVNVDEVMQEVASMAGTTPKVMRGKEEREELRAARAEAQAQQQKIEQDSVEADTAKTLSETQTKDGNALDQVVAAQQETM
jgi:hypothetical protein